MASALLQQSVPPGLPAESDQQHPGILDFALLFETA
jgi:hypothetical protein